MWRKIYQKNHCLESAAAAYKKAIELNPDFYVFYYYLAQVLEKLGKLDKSIKALDILWRLQRNKKGLNDISRKTLIKQDTYCQSDNFCEKPVKINSLIMANQSSTHTSIDQNSQIIRRQRAKVALQLMIRRRWSYLRYLHLRQGLLQATGVKSFLSIGCGAGLSEVALALEFPDIKFHLTDIEDLNQIQSRLGIRMVHEWSIPNVTYGVCDILEPDKQILRGDYDFVASVEVLEHIKNDTLAVSSMIKITRKYVYALVPFATKKMNSDPALRAQVWKNQQHHRVGYDQQEIIELFSGLNLLTVQGCYWKQFGLKMRQELEVLSYEQIKVSMKDLIELAHLDLVQQVPSEIETCFGIWLLAEV